MRCIVCRRYTTGKRYCTRRHCQQIKAEIKAADAGWRHPARIHRIGCRFDLSDPRQRAMLGLVIRPARRSSPMVATETLLGAGQRPNGSAGSPATHTEAAAIDFALALSENDRRTLHSATTAIALALFDCQ